MTGEVEPNARKPDRVVATSAALDLIAEIRAEHGPIMFHQSGGCCDGSSPMCYPAGGFRIGGSDMLLGTVAGDVPIYIGRAQGEAWSHTQLILDVVPGRGGMFSLDNGREKRFLTRGRVFTEAEQNAMAACSVAPRREITVSLRRARARAASPSAASA